MRKYVDLSHTIEDGLITYKGLPAPVICDYLSREDSKKNYDDGSSFLINKIEMVSNTGTYVDSPFHRFENGDDLSKIHIDNFVNLEGLLINVSHLEILPIGPVHFLGKSLKGKAVLINTGWSLNWKTDKYFENHPFLTKDAAEYLANEGVKMVGIDSHNIDDTRSSQRPVHDTLLKNNILIIEHLCNLAGIEGKVFNFSAAPPKIKNVGTFPVRAYAEYFDDNSNFLTHPK